MLMIKIVGDECRRQTYNPAFIIALNNY